MSKKLLEARNKYKELFQGLSDEIQKCDNETRAQVNERMGRYPVRPLLDITIV